MKKFLATLLTTVCASIFAIEGATYTCSAGTPLVSEYAFASESKIFGGTRIHRLGLTAYNGTATQIACFLTHHNPLTAPNRSATAASEELYLPPSMVHPVIYPNIPTAAQIYCRSTNNASITSGTISLGVW